MVQLMDRYVQPLMLMWWRGSDIHCKIRLCDQEMCAKRMSRAGSKPNRKRDMASVLRDFVNWLAVLRSPKTCKGFD